MVYLGMGARACKISRPLDAGFILFPFWVGLISVVPVVELIILRSKPKPQPIFLPENPRVRSSRKTYLELPRT